MIQKITKILFALLILSMISINFSNATIFITEMSTSSASSTITESIVINNDTQLMEFVSAHSLAGSGTNASPYIIESLMFNIPYSKPTGYNQSNLPILTIQNTQKNIIIRNLKFDIGEEVLAMVYLKNISNIQIINNEFNPTHDISSIEIEGGTNILIKDNSFLNTFGIQIDNYTYKLIGSTSSIDISNNYFENNLRGIFFIDQIHILVHDNYFKNCTDAVDNFQSEDYSYSNVYRNIFDSGTSGITFYRYTEGYANIYENHFFNNSETNIVLYVPINGTINNNNFIVNNNGFPLDKDFYIGFNLSLTDLTFDNGTAGNYYSSYQGNDTNNNGIGDQPYFNDKYPLMEPIIFTIESAGKNYNLPFFPPANSSPFEVLPIFLVSLVCLTIVYLFVRKRKINY